MKRRWLLSLLFVIFVMLGIWTHRLGGPLHENYKVKTFWTVVLVLVVGSGLELGSYLPSRRARQRMWDRAMANVMAEHTEDALHEDALRETAIREGVVQLRFPDQFEEGKRAMEEGKYVIWDLPEDEGAHEPTTEPPTERRA
jgi:hypothetical protein